jgi:hypothetical protein
VNSTRVTVRTAAALLVTDALALSGAGTAGAAPLGPLPSDPSATSPAAGMITLAPTSIQRFEWVQGQQSWTEPSLDRLARSVFRLDSAGGFTMVQPDGYPTLVGTVAEYGTFQAQWSSPEGGNASTIVEVSGQMAAGNGAVAMAMTYISGATTVALVDGTAHGDSRVKAFHALLILEPAS